MICLIECNRKLSMNELSNHVPIRSYKSNWEENVSCVKLMGRECTSTESYVPKMCWLCLKDESWLRNICG